MKEVFERKLIRITGVFSIIFSFVFLSIILYLLLLSYQDSGSKNVWEFILNSFSSMNVAVDSIFIIFNIFMLVYFFLTGFLAMRLKYLSRRLMLFAPLFIIFYLVYFYLLFYFCNIIIFVFAGVFIFWIIYLFNKSSVKIIYKNLKK